MIDKYFGQQLAVGFGDTYGLRSTESEKLGPLELLVLFCYSREPQKEAQEAVSKLKISSEAESNTKTSPKEIQTLHLIGNFSSKALVEVLTPRINLSTLYIHISIFETLNLKANSIIPVNLPSLKILYIDSAGISEWSEHRDENEFDFMTSLTGFVAFLRSNAFQLLHTFIVTIPFYKPMDFHIVGAISEFMTKHKDTLKSFSYHQQYRVAYTEDDDLSDTDTESEAEFLFDEVVDESELVTSKTTDGDLKACKKDPPPVKLYENSGIINYSSDVEEPIMDDEVKCEPNRRRNPNHRSQRPTRAQRCVPFLKQMMPIRLTEFHVAVRSRRLQDTSPLWYNFMIQQNQLKTILYKGFFCPLPFNLFHNNAATLTTVYMHVNGWVDLKNFSTCERLKTLMLATKYKSTSQVNERKFPDLKGGLFLPKSLETVKLKNLLTSTEEADFICLELPALKVLSLQKIGMHLNMGLSVQAFLTMWKRKTLTSFDFGQSINLASYLEFKNNDSCEISLIGFLLQHISEDFSQVSVFLRAPKFESLLIIQFAIFISLFACLKFGSYFFEIFTID